MRGQYTHRFTLPNGVDVYVPSEEGRERGKEIIASVKDRWSPRANYFHLLKGGHISAAKRHADDPVIAKLDLARFYHQVNRTKVHRALKRVGIGQVEAFEAACDSTVEINPGERNFSLPFGYVQSPLLASLALQHSAFGDAIARVDRQLCKVSIYVDDIIISGDSEHIVAEGLNVLRTGADTAGFVINEEKSKGPSSQIEIFNLAIGDGMMSVLDGRMDTFRETVIVGNEYQIEGVVNYVAAVNGDQAAGLRDLI